jgi:RNA polymerase sigma factor (sigma-70 family)
VIEHKQLVEQIARKLKSRLPPCFDLNDLVQEGVIGLIEAAIRFDPLCGVSFCRFAYKRIKGAIQESIGLHASNDSRRTTRENLWADRTMTPIAECDGDEAGETQDRSGARPDGLTKDGEQRELVATLVRTLPPRLELVIKRHYGADLNLSAIAGTDGLKVRKARISQLHAEALAKLRVSAQLRGVKLTP